MPYDSPDEVASKVRGTEKLSEKRRRQFMHVFNSCYENSSDEGKCHAQAWGVVKKSANAIVPGQAAGCGCDLENCGCIQTHSEVPTGKERIVEEVVASFIRKYAMRE